MKPIVTTLSELPQEILERWLLILSIAHQAEPNEGLKEIADAINEALELKQLNHYKGYEETKTPLGV